MCTYILCTYQQGTYVPTHMYDTMDNDNDVVFDTAAAAGVLKPACCFHVNLHTYKQTRNKNTWGVALNAGPP